MPTAYENKTAGKKPENTQNISLKMVLYDTSTKYFYNYSITNSNRRKYMHLISQEYNVASPRYP